VTVDARPGAAPGAGIPGPDPGDRVHPVRLLAITENVIDDNDSAARCQHLVQGGQGGQGGGPVGPVKRRGEYRQICPRPGERGDLAGVALQPGDVASVSTRPCGYPGRYCA
jgi:hypothetical protein